MKNVSQYPAAQNGCLSLSRLYSLLPMKVLPPVIQLGGKLLFENEQKLKSGQFSLVSQGLQIQFTESEVLATGFKNGDKVSVEVALANIQDVAEGGSVFQARQARSLKCLVPQGRELAPLAMPPQRAEQWSGFIQQVRDFLSQRSLLEVTTPSLVTNPGMEPQLQPFATELVVGNKKKTLYVPTSPELHLKQLLACDYTDIFEIKTCMRNGEITQHHQPEFQMLEWYRAYSNLSLIMSDLIGLVQSFAPDVGERIEVKVSSIADLFREHLKFQLTPVTTRDEMAELCRQNSLDFTADDSWDDLFHRLMIDKIEPKINPEVPTVVVEYPPSQAALARINEAGWADRFELYWKGFEIANAFHELNDPIEQRQRFERDQKQRLKNGVTSLDIDENFMSALESGMPPSAGIALGLDRLFMAVFNLKTIEEARLFSVKHNL